MAARWSTRELTTLSKNLVDGFPVQRMKELIPSREMGGAIQLKAQDFGFGVKTSKEDGITRFYVDIKSRVRNVNAFSEIDEVSSNINAIEAAQLTIAVPSHGINHVEPKTRIIPYDGLAANNLAIRMLTENNLSVDPDIVRCLSIHILGGEL